MKLLFKCMLHFFPFIKNVLEFYLNFLHVWAIIPFLFTFLCLPIRYLGTGTVAAITRDAELLILLDEGYLYNQLHKWFISSVYYFLRYSIKKIMEIIAKWKTSHGLVFRGGGE